MLLLNNGFPGWRHCAAAVPISILRRLRKLPVTVLPGILRRLRKLPVTVLPGILRRFRRLSAAVSYGILRQIRPLPLLCGVALVISAGVVLISTGTVQLRQLKRKVVGVGPWKYQLLSIVNTAFDFKTDKEGGGFSSFAAGSHIRLI